MSKGLEINAEIGLCTKDMAKENPIKDFEILIEEHKDKWSKQMYDYFKECLSIIKKEHKRLEELEKAFHALSKDDEKAKKLLSKEIEKNRAFEIIKKKQVNCYDIINSVDYKHYLVLMKDYDKSWLLTQEEYELLKGVLL